MNLPFSIIILFVLSHTIQSFSHIKLKHTSILSSADGNILLSKPKWAAGGIVSDLVNMLINFKPLFGMMKKGARNVLISTAEEKGDFYYQTIIIMSLI